jgi:F-type H+-transporting ATPase subunit b
MEKRTKSIEDSIEDADRQKNEAGEMKRAYEKQLKEAKLESERIINEAAAKAGLVSAKLIDDAKQEVQTMLSAARKEIEQERRQMVKEVKNEVAGLAFAAASKVVSANMDTKDNRELVEQFLDQMGAA